MKALTLTQPWATLVAIGAKQVETRSFRVSYRGPIAIHAAKGYPKHAAGLYLENPFYQALHGISACYGVSDNPSVEEIRDHLKEVRGHVLATATLLDVCPTVSTGCLSGVFEDYPDLDTTTERDFGDYAEGRFGWVLEDVKLLKYPVQAKGSLGLWEWEQVTA